MLVSRLGRIPTTAAKHTSDNETLFENINMFWILRRTGAANFFNSINNNYATKGGGSGTSSNAGEFVVSAVHVPGFWAASAAYVETEHG